jgi:multidrug efflux pump subunit AcrA (membrane-fusion protein)
MNKQMVTAANTEGKSVPSHLNGLTDVAAGFAPASGSSQGTLSADGLPFTGRSLQRGVPSRRRWAVGLAFAAFVASAAGWWVSQSGATTAPPALGTPTAMAEVGLIVRGVVRPAAWSRVGTQAGGVVTTMAADAGDTVNEGQVLARVRSPLDGSIEVISAPRAGTVTARAVSPGDSSLPGSTLFVVSDMSSLRVEVADVDEFTVARVRRGQRAVAAVPALDVQGVNAIVRSVGAQPVGASVPDAALASTTDHYPVTVDLIEPVPGLRIGMAVRLKLEE